MFDSRAQREKILSTFYTFLHSKTRFLKGFLSIILKIFRCAARVPPYGKIFPHKKPPLVDHNAATRGGLSYMGGGLSYVELS